MSVANSARISRAPIAALMCVGVFWGGFAALVPDIKSTVGASDGEFGLALIFSALGSMSSMYLAPRVGTLLGRLAIPIVGAFLVLAFFYPLLASTVTGLSIMLYFMGASVGMLDITANVRISTLESRHGVHLMNLNHAMFSFAFGGAAFVTGLARKSGMGPAEILPALAVVGALLVLMMLEKSGSYTQPKLDEDMSDVVRRPPWMAIAMTALILFCGFVGENSTEAWTALHIERTLGGAVGEGAFGPTTLGIVMGFGRLSGQFVAEKIGETRLILWSAICGTVGAVIIAVAPTQFIVLFGVAVVGLGMAVVVPSVNSVLGKMVREDQRSHAISRAWMFGMIGFFIGPSIMGGISEYFGLRIAFLAISLIIAAMIPAVIALSKLERR
jgi:predicted MFS family arabinose efflux permease